MALHRARPDAHELGGVLDGPDPDPLVDGVHRACVLLWRLTLLRDSRRLGRDSELENPDVQREKVRCVVPLEATSDVTL